MSRNRVISSILFVGIFVLFMWGIPVGLYNRNEFLFSVVGGILCFLLIGQALAEFRSLYELLESEEHVQVSKARQLAPFAIVPGFILIFVFLMHNAARAEQVLKNEGLVTKGKVEDGRSTSTTRRFRTNTTYKLEYSYTDTHKITYHGSASVNSSEFSEAYQGMSVDVVYWKKDPSVSKLLVQPHEIVTYKRILNRQLSYVDMLTILEHKLGEDSLLNYLNAINYEWLEGEGFFVNERLGMAVKRIDSNQVAFIENMAAEEPVSFVQEMERDGYAKMTRISQGKERVAYTKWPYTIVREAKVEVNAMQQISAKNVYYFIKN
ncbi:MAG TPA: DUF3592 domain-containing protein [Cytophagales bacterium]|nr:DUF3592 domain-containing protein [Cytophagales bacterium]